MSIFHDEDSDAIDMIRDISDKHCPDSVRDSAYRELKSRGMSKEDIQDTADQMYGDHW